MDFNTNLPDNPYWKTLKPIWKNPRCVYVNKERVENIASKLSREKFETPSWEEPIFPKNPVDFMKFILLANAINFCFTDPETKIKFQINYGGVLWRGSMAMAACLKRALDAGKPLFSADWLANLTINEVKNIFWNDPSKNETALPLLDKRLAILREVGEVLEKHFGGSFLTIYEISGFRAFNNDNGLVELLIKYFPSFRDERLLSIDGGAGLLLEFEKRAQLLAMVYQGRMMSDFRRPTPLLKDAGDLGPIADCAVPAALEDMGILIYSQSLKKKITAGEIIPANSREEIEIRAQTVHAMLKLLQEINMIYPGRKINMLELDYMIWKLGRGISTPRHLTPTTAY